MKTIRQIIKQKQTDMSQIRFYGISPFLIITPLENLSGHPSGSSNLHLVALLYIVIMATFLLAIMPKDEELTDAFRKISIMGSLTYILHCCHMLYNYDAPKTVVNSIGYHFPYKLHFISEYGLNLSFGVDGISLLFLLLTGFIMTLCLFALNPKETNYKTYVIYLYLVYTFLTFSFCVTNLFFFFVFFESVLIPMFLIIGLWGARQRKIKAAYYFFFFTLLGSFFLLYGIFEVYRITGSLEYETLFLFAFTQQQQKYLWFFFFIPFAIKIPMFPFHIWLPEAHVEAPTVGSVILAALLLKLGGYGFVKFLIPMFPLGCEFYEPVIHVLATISITYASLSAICQSDLKRIVAYSSIAHMNVIVLGLFANNIYGTDGGVFLMMAHGIVSAGLFFCVGVLYDRYGTRQIKNYSGLVETMPLFSAFFLLFTLGNMGFPGTCNFVGEFVSLLGIFSANTLVGSITALNIVLSAVYSIWLFNRVCFGTLKTEKQNIINYADVNRSEFLILLFLVIAMLVLGLVPSFIFDLM